MRTKLSILFLVCTMWFGHQLTGQSWTEQAIGALPDGYSVFSMSAVDENVVWAVAFDAGIGAIIPASHLVYMLKTTDGGETWEQRPIEGTEGRVSLDIVAFDENTALIVTLDYGNGSGQGVLKTTDGGETWVEKVNNIAGGVWIRFFNDQEGIILNTGSAMRTEDGGETWSSISGSFPAFLANEFTLVASGNNSCVVIDDHIWFGTSKGRIFRSNDQGQNWTVADAGLGSDAIIFSVAFSDTLNGICVDGNAGFGPVFSRTTDGGLTWEPYSATLGLFLAELTHIPETEGAFIGNTSNLTSPVNWKSTYSMDNGVIWTNISTGSAIKGALFVDANTGWAANALGSEVDRPNIFKWDGDIFVGDFEVEIEPEMTVFPNPAASTVTVQGMDTELRFRLLLPNGQVVKSGKLDRQGGDLDLSGLPLGMYHLELSDDQGQVHTKQIVKAN